MPHKFVILNKGKLEKYDEFEKIPQSFDNVIKFLPEIPDGPHTEEQHKEIDNWNIKFKELMSRETHERRLNAISNKNR